MYWLRQMRPLFRHSNERMSIYRNDDQDTYVGRVRLRRRMQCSVYVEENVARSGFPQVGDLDSSLDAFARERGGMESIYEASLREDIPHTSTHEARATRLCYRP